MCLGHPRPFPQTVARWGRSRELLGRQVREWPLLWGSRSFCPIVSAQSSDRDLALGHQLHQENTGTQERAITCAGHRPLSAMGRDPSLLWGT